MVQKLQSSASGQEYVDLDPNTHLAQEEDCDTLLVYLPGFKKKQLRLQLTTARTLKITGERQFANNKWFHLEREYPVSTNCDPHKIDAKLEDGILYIRQPKLVNSLVLKQEKEMPANEARKPDQKLANDQPRAQKTDSESENPDQKLENDQPRTQNTNDLETKSMVDQSKEKVEGKKKSVDVASVDKEDLETEKGGKRNGKVDEEGKGTMKKTTDGQESRGWGDGRVAVMVGKRPVRMMMNLVVGLLLVLVIVVYVRNWMNSAMGYGK